MEGTRRISEEGPGRTAARITQVAARHGFGYVFGRRLFPFRRQPGPEKVGRKLRLAFEELGPNFVELGYFMAARRDLLPPDVTSELMASRTQVQPIPFERVRAVVELELGNSLERLFVKFDPTPLRSGVFTQAHRALLPEDRPALVVLDRPGIRGELLSMRPVAEVVRRQLSGSLPFDPTEMVGRFAAHVSHRRDMRFAAQITRRMRDLKDIPLRIPDVYPGYSTSRVITIETPAISDPLPSGAASKLGEALFNLALVEGIFFAGLTPERLALSGEELWLADPTEVLAIDPERLRGIAEILAAVKRGDVDAILRVLPLAGCTIPADTYMFKREMREALGSLGGPLWRENSISEMQARSMEAAREGDVNIPQDIAQLFYYLTRVEGMVSAFDPAFSAAAALEPAVERLISRYRDPQYLLSRTARRSIQLDTFADYPRQIHTILNELKDGEIEVSFRHQGLDDLISKVDILANRLVFGFLISALIIGSTFMGIFGETTIRVLGIGVFGLIGFAMAAVLALALLIGIIRSGRL